MLENWEGKQNCSVKEGTAWQLITKRAFLLSTAWESFWRQTSLESAFMLQINTEWGYPAFLLMSVPQLVNLETLF